MSDQKRSTPPLKPYELDVLSDQLVGMHGFLHLRRLRLQNVRPNGTRSAEWLCDFVERNKGVDAVVLVLYRERNDGEIEVLLRDGLRPALIFGRDPTRIAMPERRAHFLFTEVVAGIIEEGEVGEAAIRARAVDEAWEEAGVHIAAGEIEMLGSSFPSPGLTAEKFFFTAARLESNAVIHPAEGDGSPMEEGSTVRFVTLDAAIDMCVAGEIEDAKTELIMRRLRDKLRA